MRRIGGDKAAEGLQRFRSLLRQQLNMSVAERRETPVLRVEDTFLRSVHPGRAGDPPIGLNLDLSGVHFDASRKSDLEQLLSDAPLDDTRLLDNARDAMIRIKEAHLSKYNAHDPHHPVPEPGYVLVLDQTEGDASVMASGADKARFREIALRGFDEAFRAGVLGQQEAFAKGEPQAIMEAFLAARKTRQG